jgi:hypothetical protein
MNRLFVLLVMCALGLFFLSRASGQDSFAGVDLLYPELAHPDKDAQEAIQRRDFRFVAIDRYGKDTPGLEGHPRLKQRYKTKLVRQPFRIIATPSQDFSFRIRARAYARQYNSILLQYLLKNKP